MKKTLKVSDGSLIVCGIEKTNSNNISKNYTIDKEYANILKNLASVLKTSKNAALIQSIDIVYELLRGGN